MKQTKSYNELHSIHTRASYKERMAVSFNDRKQLTLESCASACDALGGRAVIEGDGRKFVVVDADKFHIADKEFFNVVEK